MKSKIKYNYIIAREHKDVVLFPGLYVGTKVNILQEVPEIDLVEIVHYDNGSPNVQFLHKSQLDLLKED